MHSNEPRTSDHRPTIIATDGSRATRPRAALARRILILDGAMGTMIQRHTLTEADFRGDGFRNHSKDLRGNNDLLILTRPDVISEIHEPVPRGRRRHHRDEHVQQHGRRAGRLPPGVDRVRAEPRGGAPGARPRATTWTAKTPDRPRFVAGSIGPTNRTLSISPDVNSPSFRAITFDELRAAYEDQVRGLIDGGCDLSAARDDLRHAQRQGRHRSDPERVRGKGRAPAADDLVHDHRQERADAVGPDARRVLHLGPPREAVQHRDQLRAWRARHAAVPRRSGTHRRVLRDRRIPTRGCPTHSASTTSCPPKPATW